MNIIRKLKAWGEKYPMINNLEDIGITPLGIEYLTENSFIKKAAKMYKEAKSIIPFV